MDEGLLRNRTRLPVSSALAAPPARRTRCSVEHGLALECAGGSMIVRLPRSGGGHEIPNPLGGPDGCNGFETA